MHRELTTGDLRAEIPDVPSATLYRQVAALARGVLDVADEKRVRGAVERTYPPCTGAARVDCDEAREMTAEELRQVFLTFVVGLPADFDHYLERGDVDMARDLAEGRQNAMNLTDEEMFDVVDELRAVLEPRIALPPAPGRTRRLLATVLVPDGNALASTNTATATTSVTPGRHLPEGARLMSMVQAGSVPAARHQVRATAGPWSSSSPSLTACLSRVGHDSRPTGWGGSTGPSLPSRSGSWLCPLLQSSSPPSSVDAQPCMRLGPGSSCGACQSAGTSRLSSCLPSSRRPRSASTSRSAYRRRPRPRAPVRDLAAAAEPAGPSHVDRGGRLTRCRSAAPAHQPWLATRTPLGYMHCYGGTPCTLPIRSRPLTPPAAAAGGGLDCARGDLRTMGRVLPWRQAAVARRLRAVRLAVPGAVCDPHLAVLHRTRSIR